MQAHQPQMANVLTSNGQIQQIQIAQLANVQVNYSKLFKFNLYLIGPVSISHYLIAMLYASDFYN